MKALICFVLFLTAGALASAQTTTPKKITDYPDLGAPIDSTDWLLMHDTSANAYKRIGPANLLASKQDTSGNLTSLANLVDPNGNRMLIWNDATNEFDYQTIPTGGTLSLTGRRIPYGDNAGGYSHEAGFEYDPTFNLLKVPTMVSIGDAAGGTAFAMTVDGSGGIQLFNDFTDEDLKLNLGVGGANTAFFTSSSGVNLIDLGTIDLKVPTEVYDATNWNGDQTAPTKDAVRDKIESLAPSGGDVTAAAAFANDNRLIRSDGTGKGVQASGIIIDDSNNVSGVGSFSASSASFTNATFTNLNVDTVNFEDSDASHRTALEFGSNLTADRSLSVITGDTDRILTFQGDPTLGDWFNQSVKTSASPTFANVTTGTEAYDATNWDGDNTVPTKNDVRDKIETMGGGSGLGYVLQTYPVSNLTWSSSTTYYFGTNPSHSSAYDTAKIEIPKDGTIKRITVRAQTSVAGSSEAVPVDVWLNNTTSVGSISLNMSGTPPIRGTSSGLSQAVVAGDYIAIRVATPSFATAPTNCQLVATIYIE